MSIQDSNPTHRKFVPVLHSNTSNSLEAWFSTQRGNYCSTASSYKREFVASDATKAIVHLQNNKAYDIVDVGVEAFDAPQIHKVFHSSQKQRLHSLNCCLVEVECNKAIVDTWSDVCMYYHTFKGGESFFGLLLFEKIKVQLPITVLFMVTASMSAMIQNFNNITDNHMAHAISNGIVHFQDCQ